MSGHAPRMMIARIPNAGVGICRRTTASTTSTKMTTPPSAGFSMLQLSHETQRSSQAPNAPPKGKRLAPAISAKDALEPLPHYHLQSPRHRLLYLPRQEPYRKGSPMRPFHQVIRRLNLH